jgi:hypothetical protein
MTTTNDASLADQQTERKVQRRDTENGERKPMRRSKELAIRNTEAVKLRDKEYKVLAEHVLDADQGGIRARWEFGKALVAERGDRKKLPDKRLETVCGLVGKKEREVQQWMAFFETYPTENQLRTAMRNSWTQIKASITRANKEKEEARLLAEGTLTLQPRHAKDNQPKDPVALSTGLARRLAKRAADTTPASKPVRIINEYEIHAPGVAPWVSCNTCKAVWNHECKGGAS